MGANEEVPLILGRSFLHTTSAVIYVGLDQIHFQFPRWKVKCAFNGYKANKQVKVVHPKRRSRPTKRQENKKDEQARRPNKSRRINPLNQNHNLNPKRFGGRRRCTHLGLHLWDRLKHPKHEHNGGVLLQGLKTRSLADR